MYLYRLEVETDIGTDTLVVISDSDEQAFAAAEDLFEKHHLVKPKSFPLILLEKVRIQAKSGYYIRHRND